MQRKLYPIFILTALLFFSNWKRPEQTWKEIDKGLFYSEFNSPVKSAFSDSKISILKIEPAYYKFSLVSAKEKNESAKTAKEWATDKKLIAVINAGMFLEDGKTNTGFMKNFNFINNSKLNSDNTITAFNRKDTTVPFAQIIDRECQSWDSLKEKYNSFTQGIRMIDCKQKNKWAQQDKKWSMVIIGKDKKGNMLFIFSRSPYTVHDFIDILLKLPIEIYNAQYLEGGPEASFYLDCKGTQVEKFGSYETGFNENDDNKQFWKIPNVIGISKK
ncbi:MAG: phosphodiester glycosidase family protein [Bacteroidia bacterium]|nr:phosphodiester glycosidase family protein [Bacteroidia bacterium]